MRVAAIQVCNAVAMAKKQGQTKPADGDPIGQYAQSLVNANTANAEAVRGTVARDSSPFYGYYFRVVTANLWRKPRTMFLVARRRAP